MSKFTKSEAHLIRAERSIPLGSQTFSKSRTQYPVGISPLYIERAQGCKVWDIDGNEYIDLVSSLASVTIGYRDKKIDQSVRNQLKKGVTFSLPGKLEAEVSELIVKMVPCAEKVRFGKNGSDATSAAVRLARAYTGRDHVAVCGYHGWQDWYIGSTTRNKGVPESVSDMTHTFIYNDLESLRTIVLNSPPLACVIMEPMNSTYPDENFLREVRNLTKANGIVLIFDETITGFRFSRGGAQELFGVLPDLATFGKGMANGYPLSAIVGKSEIMDEMENIFFSGTFGGELLSLAACKSVLEMHANDEVVPNLIANGKNLNSGVTSLLKSLDLDDVVNLSGHETWKFLNWLPNEKVDSGVVKTYFWQEIFDSGLIMLNSHNISLSHNTKAVSKILNIYEQVLEKISLNIQSGTIRSSLRVPPLEPLFKIR